MKVLVVIANYGRDNDEYLHQLIYEYRSMSYDVHIVVLSNIQKTFDSDIELIVGLPNKNPRSLPFAHRKIFFERIDQYDLFIYSEDDTLVTERNIEAFLQVTSILPKNKIAGFLRSEKDIEGRLYFSTVHSYYHWEPNSIRAIGEYIFAHFTNEHSACYMLTQEQLRYTLESGGFFVSPHQGKYDLLETAATDPYTQCGLEKLICISHLEDFTVRHLSNKYLRKLGLESTEFYRQIEVLLSLEKSGRQSVKLLDVETKLQDQRWSKSYYEDIRFDILSVLPRNIKYVLSIGCGWGATEEELVRRDIEVVGVPLDSVIAACAEAKEIDIVYGDFKTVKDSLANERFDCIILSNILHIVHDPIDVLSSFTDLLSIDGRVVVGLPNLSYLPNLWRRIRRVVDFQALKNYDTAGLHLTTHRVAREWFAKCQLVVDEIVDTVQPRWQFIDRLLLGLASAPLASDFVVIGRKVEDCFLRNRAGHRGGKVLLDRSTPPNKFGIEV